MCFGLVMFQTLRRHNIVLVVDCATSARIVRNGRMISVKRSILLERAWFLSGICLYPLSNNICLESTLFKVKMISLAVKDRVVSRVET